MPGCHRTSGLPRPLFSGNAQARAKFEEAFKSLREDGPAPPVGDMPPTGYRSVTRCAVRCALWNPRLPHEQKGQAPIKTLQFGTGTNPLGV